MGKPKRQFSRPSIDLGTPLKRTWQNVPVSAIKVFDLIPGYGLVTEVLPEDNQIVLHFKNGSWDSWVPEATVFAFATV